MTTPGRTGRLSILAAAMVVARRDFLAVLFSRSFIFFLIGPLFPVLVGGLAGGVGIALRDQVDRPVVGIIMDQADAGRLLAARHVLVERIPDLPELVRVAQVQPGQSTNPVNVLIENRNNLGAIVSGTLDRPVLTGPRERTDRWSGQIALLAAQATGRGVSAFPPVETQEVATSRADERHAQIITAQAGQTLLFLLTMLLAGMVMSNLVEEKANKIIEVLAAAIPMEAMFLGKLFAMLGVSLVGIATWGAVGTGASLLSGKAMPLLAAPAVGWLPFIALGIVYFSMAYLLLGSMFLAIGGMATTVRDVQTLSMPVTMLQLLVFFFASYAMAKPGSPIELAAITLPFSSPYAMLARAAQDPRLWIHGAALGWQVLCVALFVRIGATLFRKRVMKSGPVRGKSRRGLWRRATA